MALAAAILGCTLPWTDGGRNVAATMVVETVSALQTGIAASQTAQPVPVPPVATATAAAAALPTSAPFVTPVPLKPVVQTTSLCWNGPGPVYAVVSSVKAGTAVTVLGVGSITGWFVIENPTYRDRCWIEAKNLALDPFFNTAGMQVFNPPPTPGPKITPGPSPTP
jgi:uncharacterized protein YgiM (DUF1202 family)